MRPKRSSARPTSRSGSPGCEGAALTCSSPTPSPRRPDVTPPAPSPPSCRATSRPIPPVDPVTMQTLSPRPSSMVTSLDGLTTFLIVRHGQSTWNAEHRWQGLPDPPLSELGSEQARALAAELHDVPLHAVYASDLQRARETAEAVA